MQLTNSPYSHLTFTLIITLPPNYPEDPPALNFVDKIYHLNVDPANGEVHMPILSDDWSPFLTLAAVLDSLDNLLE
jgi:ubiquitin-protein ligase